MKKIISFISLFICWFVGIADELPINLTDDITTNMNYTGNYLVIGHEEGHGPDKKKVLTINTDCTLSINGTITINAGCKLVINGILTATNIINNGEIQLNGAVLYATTDITLNPGSKLKFQSGESYVGAGHDIIQSGSDGGGKGHENAKIELQKADRDHEGATGSLIAVNSFVDNTKLDGDAEHPWKVEGINEDGEYVDSKDKDAVSLAIKINDKFNFATGEYNYTGTAVKGWDGKGPKREEWKADAWAKFVKELSTAGVNAEEVVEIKSKISGLLPIELVYFIAYQKDNVIFFGWKTGTETNNDYFTIEYSIDGMNFHELTTVAGSGTTSEATSYNYVWNADESGLFYFRLKQTDYNGEFSYPKVVALNFDKETIQGIYFQNGKIMYNGNPLRL